LVTCARLESLNTCDHFALLVPYLLDKYLLCTVALFTVAILTVTDAPPAAVRRAGSSGAVQLVTSAKLLIGK
jgi:hypothetical protein